MNKKRNLYQYIGAIIIMILCSLILEGGYRLLYRNIGTNITFSIDRSIIFIFISLFISLHILIQPKKIWDFIYKKRYWIGVSLFCVIVLRGYHGSSVFQYNNIIEPNYPINENAPILGISKAIRSDEYLVDTPGILSQVLYNEELNVINNAIMAREGTTVYMFPQLPTKSISVLSNPKLLGFLFLPIEQAFSFYWYILFFVCFFATFEVCMIITKKKKIYSLMGACLLTFSPAFLWWNQLSIFAGGFSAIAFIYYFIKSDNKWMKLLYSLLVGYAGTVFIMTLYPAWLVPFGYLFLGLFLWILIENKKSLKWNYLWYLIPSILVMLLILIPGFIGSSETVELMGKTLYPAARSSIGGYGENLLFNYFIAPFYTIFKNIGNACEASQFIGLYPIPLFIGIYHCFKNKKEKSNDSLLIILVILSVFLSIWNYLELPLFSKLTLLSISTPDRAQMVINAIMIMILIRVISNYEINEYSKNRLFSSIVISIVFSIFGIYIVKQTYPDYVTLRVAVLSFIVFSLIISLFILNYKKTNMLLVTILILISLFNFGTVQPVSKGLGVMSEKPIAQEIRKILNEDKESKWVMVNSGTTTIFGQNYILSNGARVINSTNYYPNFSLWKQFDSKSVYDEVYNRYAHIAIDIVNDETRFELLQADLFKAYISMDEIDKLDAKYFVSADILTSFKNKDYHFEEIYRKDNLGIYQLCKN